MSEGSEKSAITPNNNPILQGHEKAEEILLDAWKRNALHNSWLISGIEGIGKATLAYRFARFLLSADENKRESYTSLNVSQDNPIYRLIANNSHPDLKVLERDYTETDRKKILKSIKSGEQLSEEEQKNLKRSAFIKVDEVRTVNEFLSKRSSNDGWRVVIIDSIDDMNTASANAILKILEEPPHKALMLLISHNPARLLATIKSRCAKLPLLPLEDKVLSSLIRRYRPELEEQDVKELTELCSGSIGKAIRYAEHDAIEIYERLVKVTSAANKPKLAEQLSFCDENSSSEDNYELCKELFLKRITERIKRDKEKEELAKLWEKAVQMFDETERLNMDKKQVLQQLVYNLSKISEG